MTTPREPLTRCGTSRLRNNITCAPTCDCMHKSFSKGVDNRLHYCFISQEVLGDPEICICRISDPEQEFTARNICPGEQDLEKGCSWA